MPKVKLSHNEILKKYIEAGGGSASGNLSLSEALKHYDDLLDALRDDSPTADDSDGGLDCSNTIETMDNVENKWWSADSDEFVAQISARAV